jgi:hypothetical protein
MKSILLLHDENGSPKPRLQNVAGSKVTQRPSEGTPGCNCDRWGHPSPDCVEHNVHWANHKHSSALALRWKGYSR